MQNLTERDKRTIRIAAIGITVYLVLFCGFKAWKHLEKGRSDYQKLVQEAQRIERELRPYENKVLLIEKLKETYRMDPSKLAKSTLVAEASAAIQKAASSGGIQLGPIRETAGRPSAKEIASMQIEASGPVAAIIGLIPRLETLGFPMILDTVQITVEASKPGMVKLSMTVVILDFEQWKNEEARNA